MMARSAADAVFGRLLRRETVQNADEELEPRISGGFTVSSPDGDRVWSGLRPRPPPIIRLISERQTVASELMDEVKTIAKCKGHLIICVSPNFCFHPFSLSMPWRLLRGM